MDFRFAVREDTALILRFIKALAAYEKMSGEVVADEKTLEEWLFDRRKAEVLFVLDGGEEVGFALFFHNFSTFLGRAGLYLKKLAAIAVERGCGRMEWWCLDWNEHSIGFYRSLGAEAMSDWTVYRLSGDTLKSLAE